MTEENLVTNIVAKSDFSNLIGDLNKVSSRLLQLQEQLNGTNRTLAAQAANMQKAFSSTLRSTGQFSTHFVSLQSDVDKFGKSLDSGRMKLGQYYKSWQEHSKTSGGLIRDLAKQQVMMQNAILQPLGKNAQGLMQFNVQIPRGLDVIKNKTQIARQEMMIMNKVIQDGANQVINWGKNTQWAGRQLTVGLTVPIAMFGKAAADAFKQADEELVRLTKVYGGVAATSAQELGRVRKEVSATARELSAAYGASYKDTISLAADIAATGKQGSELIKSTQETTRLSILGEVDRQEAMKATLAIQTAFNQNTKQLGESINFLNAVENQTSTSLADLIEAIPKAGPVIQAMGGSIKDLALYMTAMKEGGINASEGANALKSALASLVNPTKVAKEMFQGFGIDLGGIVTQNAGNLTGTLMQLKTALDQLNPLQKQQAIEQLFGKFQFARMNALFENLGKQGSQTLQVLDLMKASTTDLANIAGRELSQITESASGKYRRALETLKADMAGVGEQFLTVGTKLINIIDGVLRFFNKLPDPIKSVLGFVAGLTALTGPIIMLTGLMANFFGYIAKGLFHFKALLKGGEGFKLLTPELMAAEKAGNMLAASFYDDAKAAAVLKQSISQLIAELNILETKANSARVSLNPTISTVQGRQIIEGATRVADPSHPLIGAPYSRAFAHLNPVSGMTQAQKENQTIFGVVPNPGPLNQKISNAPQMYMSNDMPVINGITGAKGFSTGIVASEAAKWHSMTAALSMQSEQELAILKREVAATGTITSSLSESYSAMLPKMMELTSLAADEGKLIVAELQSGKITVDQARAKIISLNATIEAMMAETTAQVATSQGRIANLTTVPLTTQPVVDPTTGKSNMKELFHKTKTSAIIDQLARQLGVRTSGGGYSIATTKVKRLATGGQVFRGSNPAGIDTVPAMLTEGEFVVNKKSAQENLPLLQAINGGSGSTGPGYVIGGTATRLPGSMIARLFSRYANLSSGARRPSRPGINASLRNVGSPGAIIQGRTQLRNRAKFVAENPELSLGLPQNNNEVSAHLLTNDFLKMSGAPLVSGSSPRLMPSAIEERFGYSPASRSGYAGEYDVLGNFMITTSKSFNTKLVDRIVNGKLVKASATPADWFAENTQPKHLTSLLHFLMKNYGATYDQSIGVAEKVLLNINAKMARIPATSTVNDLKLGNMMYAATRQELNAFSMTPLGRNLEITRMWPKPEPMWPMGYQYNIANDNPLHGPIQIGSAARVSGDDTGEIGRKVSYQTPQGFPFFKTVLPGGTEEQTAMYIARAYAAGNRDIMDRMAYETQNGLNSHPLSLQSLLKPISQKFTGTLHRGIPQRNLSDSLPQEIVNAIKLARESGNYEGLIGREFFVRRSSFSESPLIAQAFKQDPGSGILLEALIRNRNTTPISKLFPDLKFIAPHGQKWGSGSKELRSEMEHLVGGKFIIRGFDGQKLQIETRAKGGNVNAGQPYLVGEQGPELFVPMANGGIVPNNSLKGNKTTIPGAAGTNVYGLTGQFPAVPGLTFMSSTIAELKLLAAQSGTAIMDATRKMHISSMFFSTDLTESANNISTSLNNGSKKIKASAATMAASAQSFATMANPGLLPAQGQTLSSSMGKNFKYGASQLINPFGFGRGKAWSINPGKMGPAMPWMARMGGGMSKFTGTGMMSMMAGSAVGATVGGKVGGDTGAFIGSIAGPMVMQKAVGGISKLGTALKTASLAGKGLGYGLKLALGVGSRFLPIVGTVLTIGQALWTWKKNAEAVGKANRAAFGATKESLKEVGIEYKSLNDRIKDATKSYDDQRKHLLSLVKDSKGKMVGGLTLTKKELDAEVKRIKETNSETVQDFNKTSGKENVLKLAASLKQQYVTAGMSVTEATNKVYAFIKASDKAQYAFEAITTKTFKAISDTGTAADYAIKNVIKNLNSAHPEELAVGVENVINALDAYKTSLIGTKDANGNILTDLDAQQKALDRIIALKGSENKLTKDTLTAIGAQNFALGSVLTTAETLQSVYAKSALLQNGMGNVLDVGALGPDQAVMAAKGMDIVLESTIATLNAQAGLGKAYTDLGKVVTLANKAQVDPNVQKSLEARIKLSQKNIQLIKEETDARLKALEIQKQEEDFKTSLKKEQLAYQAALASGDLVGAAQAQLNIQSLSANKQIEDAKQAIIDQGNKKTKAEEAVATKAQEALDKKTTAVQQAQIAGQAALTQQTAIGNYRGAVASILAPYTKESFASLSKDKKNEIVKLLQGALSELKSVGGKATSEASALEKLIGKDWLKYIDDTLVGVQKNLENNPDYAKFTSSVNLFYDAVAAFAKANGVDLGKYTPVDRTSKVTSTTNSSVVIRDPNNPENKVVLGSDAEGRQVYTKPKSQFPAGGRGLGKGSEVEFTWDSSLTNVPNVITAKVIIQGVSADGTNFLFVKKAAGGYIEGFEPGGKVKGPGTGTSDSIPAMLSNGEYVVKADSVKKYGIGFMDDLNAGKFAMGGAVPGYKDGSEGGVWSKIAHFGVKAFFEHMTPSFFGYNPAYELGGGKELGNIAAGEGTKSDYLGVALSSIPGGGASAGVGKLTGKLAAKTAVGSRLIKAADDYKVLKGATHASWDAGLSGKTLNPVGWKSSKSDALGRLNYFMSGHEGPILDWAPNYYKPSAMSTLKALTGKGLISETEWAQKFGNGIGPGAFFDDSPVWQNFLSSGYKGIFKNLPKADGSTGALTGEFGLNFPTKFKYVDPKKIITPKVGKPITITAEDLEALAVAAKRGIKDGGYIDVPKFENGINMVPANMLAMLHKNEAVVPANMNPFNPNAQSYMQPSVSYNIAPVINAAPGMDEQAIANMATRQVLAEFKKVSSLNNATMGRPEMRVIR